MTHPLSDLLCALAAEDAFRLDAGRFSLNELIRLAAAAAVADTELLLRGDLDRFTPAERDLILEAGGGCVHLVAADSPAEAAPPLEAG